MRITISEFMDDAAVAQLRARFDVLYDPTLVDNAPALQAAVETSHALIVRNRTRVDAGLIAKGASLKAVGRLGVGLDNIDLPACEARNIAVIPATGANSKAVAEYVVATAMMLLRGSFLASSDVLQGRWPRARLSEGRELGGKVLGLAGFGGIGQLTARLAQGLGMQVIAFDTGIPADAPVWEETGVRPVEMGELLIESDVISLHVPLVEGTRNLFDEALIARMKPGAILINSARGGIVDEAALSSALKQGQLSGAALDVFDTEPLNEHNHFAGVPNLILTPHIAGVTAESNQRVSQLIADKIAAHLSA